MRTILLALLLLSAPAFAASYTVPIDVGIGPAAYVISGPVFDDQPIHFGLKFNVDAVNPEALPGVTAAKLGAVVPVTVML